MKSHSYQTLRELYQEQLKKISDALIKNNRGEEINSQIEWLMNAEKILERSPKVEKKKNFKLGWALIIGLVCMLVFGLGFLPVSRTWVKIEITTDRFAFRLAEDLGLGLSLHPVSLAVDNLDELHWDLDHWKSEELQGGDLYADEGYLNLIIEEIHQKAEINLSREASTVRMEIKNDTIPVQLDLDQSILLIENIGIDSLVKHPDGIPSTLKFSTIGLSDPIQFDLEVEEGQLNFEQAIVIDSIGFQMPISSQKFVSTIQQGKVEILSTKETYLVNTHENLLLDIDFANPLDLRMVEGNMQITLICKVRDIKYGFPGFIKSLKPSIIDHFYRNEKTTFFWGVIVWLWGFLFSIKNLLFSNQ